MKIKLLSLLAVVQLSYHSTFATEHIVLFGGASGNNYVPNSLNVIVGDTITWNGNFGLHPLASTGVPAGALTFANSSGSTFFYIVAVAGVYDYECVAHTFTGQFTAVDGSGVTEHALSIDFQVSPNVTNGFVNLLLAAVTANSVTVEISDLNGKKIMPDVLITERITPVDFSHFSKGIYFLTATRKSGEAVVERIVKN
jgi:plastocyanin